MRVFEQVYILRDGVKSIRGPMTLRDLDLQYPGNNAVLHACIDLELGEAHIITETEYVARLK